MERGAAAAVTERMRRVESGLLPSATLRAHGIESLQPLALSARMEQLGVPGVGVAVIHDGHVEWARGYGVADAARRAPVTVDTLFQAASISKPVTATAALRLVEAGRLDLDEDVNRSLTSWRVPPSGAWQPRLTVRRLLSHTAGLTVHGFPGYPRDATHPTLLQVLDGTVPANTAPIRVDTVPGTQLRYSGGGYCVLQQLLVDVTGRPFPELMRELVLDPLGMSRSTFEQPLPERRWSEAAAAHQGGGGPIPGHWHVYPEQAAAGLWTTPSDLARFAIAIQEARHGRAGAILSPATAQQLLSPQVEDHIGLGLFLEGRDEAARFAHGGGNAGFRCELRAFVHRPLGAVVMTNADAGGQLVAEVMRAIAREYAWPEVFPSQRRPAAVDPQVLATYAGEYELRPGVRLAVAVLEGGLLACPAGQDPISFFPESETRFFAEVVNTELTFTRDGGEVAGLTFRQNGRDLPGKKVV